MESIMAPDTLHTCTLVRAVLQAIIQDEMLGKLCDDEGETLFADMNCIWPANISSLSAL
jgi:hypothetical protein